MIYIEWLRVARMLRNTAIVMAVFFIIAVITRISVSGSFTVDQMIGEMKANPGTVTTYTTLPNGAKRTTMVNAGERKTAQIDDEGYGGKHITITEPVDRGHYEHLHAMMGSLTVQSTPGNDGMQTIVVDTNGTTDLSLYFGVSVIVGLILATILGSTFARENDGHLEIALTKPVDRIRLALAMMGIDAAGIIAGLLMMVVTLILCQSLFQFPHIGVSVAALKSLVSSVLLSLLWFALLNAATASLRRGYGAIVGFAWPAAILIIVLGTAPLGSSLIAHAIHNIFWVLSQIDPLNYAQLGKTTVMSQGQDSVGFGYLVADLPARCATLLVIYVIAAVAQWRRVEA